MFVGAINTRQRSFMKMLAPYLDGRPIYVGCSGNFTVEAILSAEAPHSKLYSNDVSIYSCLVGAALTGRPFRLEIKDRAWDWLEPYLDTPPARIATLLLLLDMLAYEKRNNAYKRRMWAEYEEQWPRLHERSVERVKRGLDSIRLDGFFAGDVLEHFATAPPDAVCISFPPTYKGGYERIYRRLDEIFDWDAPAYEEFGPESWPRLMAAIGSRDYVLSADEPKPIKGLVATFRTSLRARPVYVYTNIPNAPLAIARYAPEVKPGPYKVWSEADEFTPETVITFQELTRPVFDAYRAMYLNPEIVPAAAVLYAGWFADGKLFGFTAINRQRLGFGGAYVLSDFVVRPTRYKRLSKLVVMLMLTEEFRRFLERRLREPVHFLDTTAFTDKPVSMKYRGPFELIKRGDGYLQYRGFFTGKTIKEEYETWLIRYGRPSSD